MDLIEEKSYLITNNKNSRKNNIFLIQCTFVGMLIFLGIFNNIFTVGALTLASVLVLKGNSEQCTQVLFMLLPLASIFKFSPGKISMFTFITILVIIKLLFERRYYKLRFKSIFLVLFFMSYVVGQSGYVGLSSGINIFVGLVLMLLLFHEKKNISLNNIVTFFSLGILIASVIGLFFEQIPQLNLYIDQATIKLDQGTYTNRFSGLQGNPNYYTLDVIMALSCLLVVNLKEVESKKNYIYIILISIFGLMSISKSFLIAFFLLIIIYLLMCLKQNLTRFLKSIIFIIITAIIMWITIGDKYINTFIFRLNQDLVEGAGLDSITTGRTIIWENYMNYILTNVKIMLFGAGLNAPLIGAHVTHNLYIELWYALGIIGTLIYCGTIGSLLKIKRKIIKRNLINYIPLVILLIRGLGISMLTFDNLIFYFILVWLSINIEDKKIYK